MIDNGNGTITDESTGLMWQQKTQEAMTWVQAVSYCENLSLAGHNAWRLPTVNELQSLVDYSRCNPAINVTYFPDTVSSFYWASTTYVGGNYDAWGVDFDNGYNYSNYKYCRYNVRAVRWVGK